MLEIKHGKRFRKDYKRLKKQGKNLDELENVVFLLQRQEALPKKYSDHVLTGNRAGFRDCHVAPDWVLIYRAGAEILELSRTGSHSELKI